MTSIFRLCLPSKATSTLGQNWPRIGNTDLVLILYAFSLHLVIPIDHVLPPFPLRYGLSADGGDFLAFAVDAPLNVG